MRIDRFIGQMTAMSRSEASLAVRKGRVAVDGVVLRDPSAHIDPERQSVTIDGKETSYKKNVYIMMNKPVGAVCATEDGDLTVIDLLPPGLKRTGLFPCGRLDKNTTGFVLITDNGKLAHRLLAPASHVAKTYRFSLKFPFSDEDIALLEKGIVLEDGSVTLPCGLKRLSSNEGEITLHEGKFHQIKRMFLAVHNQVRTLSRISFAGIPLDKELAPGKCRLLSEDEAALLESYL